MSSIFSTVCAPTSLHLSEPSLLPVLHPSLAGSHSSLCPLSPPVISSLPFCIYPSLSLSLCFPCHHSLQPMFHFCHSPSIYLRPSPISIHRVLAVQRSCSQNVQLLSETFSSHYPTFRGSSCSSDLRTSPCNVWSLSQIIPVVPASPSILSCITCVLCAALNETVWGNKPLGSRSE